MHEQTIKHQRLIVLAIILAGFSFKLLICSRPLGDLCLTPLYDDSFYSLGIARNIAQGKGITFDGYTKTDGFQPLYVFMMVPVYRAFENAPVDVPIKACMILSALVSVAAGLVAFSLIRFYAGAPAAIVALAAFMFDPNSIRQSINGLETGLATFFVFLSAFIYVRGFARAQTPSFKYALALGCSIGLGILARLDHGLFAVGMGIDLILRVWKSDPSARKKALSMLSIAAVTSAIIAGPWFIYVKSTSGSFMPTSGKAIRTLSIAYGDWMVDSRGQSGPKQFAVGDLEDADIPGWYYLGIAEKAAKEAAGSIPLIGALFKGPGLVFLFLLIGLAAVKKKRGYSFIQKSSAFRFLIFSFPLILAVYCFHIFGHWFFDRYFFPFAALAGLIITGIVVNAIFDSFADKRVRWIIVCILIAIPLVWGSSDTFGKRKKVVSDYYAAALWVKEKTPPDAVIGAFQAGTIGYLSERKTVNLDGVVNHDAYIALKRKEIDIYAQNRNIDYLIDWQSILKLAFINRSSVPESINQYEQVGTVGGFVILKRREFDNLK